MPALPPGMCLELGNGDDLVTSGTRTADEGGTLPAAAVTPGASEAVPALPTGMWLELADCEDLVTPRTSGEGGMVPAVVAGVSSGGSLKPELLELYATSASWSYVWLSP